MFPGFSLVFFAFYLTLFEMDTNQPQRRVLMLAYKFPPDSAIGALRVLKFAKYLPQFGWQPTVLTVKHRDVATRDETLRDELPPDVEVIETESLEPQGLAHHLAQLLKPIFRHKSLADLRSALTWRLKALQVRLCFPDLESWWLPIALPRALRLIHRGRFDAIYATGAPWTTLWLGAILKRLTGLPYLADFRDPWTRFEWWRRDIGLFPHYHQSVERGIARAADVICHTTPGLVDDHAGAYAEFHCGHKVRLLCNGYDPAEFEDLAPTRDEPGKLLFCHLGSCYSSRSPKALFTALARVLAEEKNPASHIRMNFIGGVSTAMQTMFDSFHPSGVVALCPSVPHEKALQTMLRADVLILFQGRGMERMFPGKVFEYLAAGRHILVLTSPEAGVKKLVESAGNCTWADIDDAAGIQTALRGIFERFRAGRLQMPRDSAVVNRYSRRELTRRLADMLNEITIKPNTRN